VSGIRLVIGAIVMALAVPITLFLLLDLHTRGQFATIAVTTFCSWGVADLLSTILERPRLKGRSPGDALKEDWQRRGNE
jgi:hypothetical protein